MCETLIIINKTMTVIRIPVFQVHFQNSIKNGGLSSFSIGNSTQDDHKKHRGGSMRATLSP